MCARSTLTSGYALWPTRSNDYLVTDFRNQRYQYQGSTSSPVTAVGVAVDAKCDLDSAKCEVQRQTREEMLVAWTI